MERNYLDEVRNTKLTTIEAVQGTFSFFYYVTLGYFFDWEKFNLSTKLFREI